MYLGREEKENNCSLGGGGGEGEQLWMGRGAEGEQLSFLGEEEDNSCNLGGGEQRYFGMLKYITFSIMLWNCFLFLIYSLLTLFL